MSSVHKTINISPYLSTQIKSNLTDEPTSKKAGQNLNQYQPREESIEGLLQQIQAIQLQRVEAADGPKEQLQSHPLMPVLFQVLCELKQKTGLSISHGQTEGQSQPDPQLVRLDNMLIAEGVTEPTKAGGSTTASSSR